jgi:hypothetical protein
VRFIQSQATKRLKQEHIINQKGAKKMSENIVKMIKMIWAFFPDSQKKWILDKFLDYIENTIDESKNKLDDEFLPLIGFFRESFDIPDND